MRNEHEDMGINSYPLFARPGNVQFTYDKVKSLCMDEKTYYMQRMLEGHDSPISTASFMQDMIDDNEHGIKIYGYMTKEHVHAWELLLTDILDQNKKETMIQFHFYCEDGVAFYIQGSRQDDKIRIDVMRGVVYDAAYHDVTYEDYDENPYDIDELEDIKIEDKLRKHKCEMLVNYQFNAHKYKIVYDFDNVVFTTYHT